MGRERIPGTSLVVQWFRLCASNAGGGGSIPGLGTRIPHAVGRAGVGGEGFLRISGPAAAEELCPRCQLLYT